MSGVGIGLYEEEAARSRWNKRYTAQVFSRTHIEEGRFTNVVHIIHVPVIWDLTLYRKVGSTILVIEFYYHCQMSL